MSKFMYYSVAALSGRPGVGCIYCMCCEEFQDSNSAGLFLCVGLILSHTTTETHLSHGCVNMALQNPAAIQMMLRSQMFS